MSRVVVGLVLFGLAATTFACGEPDSSSSPEQTNQRLGGDKNEIPQTPPPGSPQQCFDRSLSSPSVCLSGGAWSKITEAACAAEGASLQNMALGAACQGGPTKDEDPNQKADPNQTGPSKVASSTDVKYRCCVPPRMPPIPGCLRLPLASSTDPKSSAAALCIEKKLELSSIETEKDSTQVAVCCAPHPVPPACQTFKVDGVTMNPTLCLDKTTAEQKAKSYCATQKLTFSSFKADPCTNGVVVQTVTCCEASITPTPQK